MCVRPGPERGYTETFSFDPSGRLTDGKNAARYGYDKMIATYCSKSPGLACLNPIYFDTATDDLEELPQQFTGDGANRLQNHFTSLHTTFPTSWANSSGSLIGFCSVPCP